MPDSQRQPGGSKESGQERKKQGEGLCPCRPASMAVGSIRVWSQDTDQEAQGLGNNGNSPREMPTTTAPEAPKGQLVWGQPSAAEAVCPPAQALPPTMTLPGYLGVCVRTSAKVRVGQQIPKATAA